MEVYGRENEENEHPLFFSGLYGREKVSVNGGLKKWP
jgi:hypothetical protein